MSNASDILGNVERTDRGFEFIEFIDRYCEKCSLQQSSLAEYEQPGSSAVWLGLEGQRMHLSRTDVIALMVVLNRWIETGSFDGDKQC